MNFLLSKLSKLKANKSNQPSDFKGRSELKFLISFGEYEILRQRFKAALYLDPNSNALSGDYHVSSLYFDDNYQTALNSKISGEYLRRKFRIRAYNYDISTTNLECKAKMGEFVSKQKHRLSKDEYYQMLKGDYSFINERYEDTVLETFSRASIILGLRPTVVVDYQREAYIYPFGNVRLTFDKELRCSLGGKDMFSDETEFLTVLNNEVILEVKYDEYLPSHITALFSGLNLNKQSVSKFVYCTEKVLEVKHNVFK